MARHGGRAQYRANEADSQAWESALRPKTCLLFLHDKLRNLVASKLLLDWSPQQISGWLKSLYPGDASLRVSHETIYRSLFIQARGALKQELVKHLRSQRRIRRSRHASVHGHSQGRIIDAISIRERPAEIEDRAIPGHWEGDLLRGTRNSHVATLVERHSRFVMLVKAPGKDTATVVATLSQHVLQFPATLRRSLTWDRGLEMAQHKNFTVATDVKVYFCDPQSPWQRGSNENTNGLLHQYLPKKTDLSTFGQEELDQIALRLNQRPRKRWDLKLRRINSKPELHRPLEITPFLRTWPTERETVLAITRRFGSSNPVHGYVGGLRLWFHLLDQQDTGHRTRYVVALETPISESAETAV